MTTDSLHEELQSLLGVFALDAVDPEEAFLIGRHLVDCPRCRAEVDAHREIAGAIASQVEPLPEGLWDRISTALADSPSPRLLGSMSKQPAMSPDLAGVIQFDSGSVDNSRPVSVRRWRLRATQAFAAAAVVVAGVLAVNLSGATHHADQLQSALAGKAGPATVAAALQVPGHQIVVMRSTEGVQLASFVLLPDGSGYLVSSKMALLPGDETYQLWGVIDHRSISLALLGSRPHRAAFTVASARPASLAITAEPAGGATTPDGAVVANGAINSD